MQACICGDRFLFPIHPTHLPQWALLILLIIIIPVPTKRHEVPQSEVPSAKAYFSLLFFASLSFFSFSSFYRNLTFLLLLCPGDPGRSGSPERTRKGPKGENRRTGRSSVTRPWSWFGHIDFIVVFFFFFGSEVMLFLKNNNNNNNNNNNLLSITWFFRWFTLLISIHVINSF